LIRAAAVAALVSAASVASAATLFSNNFETNANGFSGAGGIEPSQGYAALGYGNSMWRNDTVPALATTLSLNLALPATGVALSLSFAAIDSWDNGNFCCGPDSFVIALNGSPVFSQVFDNYLGAGATVAPGLTSVSYNTQLGFNGSFNDAAYTITLNLGNLGAGTHSITFSAAGPGWQGGFDESWGIDNVLITGTLVPEPASLALMLAGVCGLAAQVRRSIARR
jgi:hypothetical protein